VANVALTVAKSRTQIGAVMILVTRQTLPILDWPVVSDFCLPSFHMTLITLMFGMRTDQGISSFFQVIKGLGWFPLFCRMTEATFFSFEFTFEVVDVVRLMAEVTGVDRPEVASLVLTNGFLATLLRMTVDTFRLSMGSVESESRSIVIELILIEGCGIERPAFMILVAINTCLTFHQTMIVCLGI